MPEEELCAFSQRALVPLYQIQAVASFYPHFRLQPGSKVDAKVCADLSCHIAGARQLRQAAERHAASMTTVQWEQCRVLAGVTKPLPWRSMTRFTPG